MRYDIDQINKALDADRSSLCNALGLQADGNRFLCHQCQNDGAKHVDGDFSIEVGFKCHKCGWKGSGFNLVMDIKKCGFKEALDYIGNVYHIAPITKAKTTTASPKNEKGKTIHPTIERAVEASQWFVEFKSGHTKKYTLTRQDPYTDEDGAAVAYMLRFDCPEGKEYCPIHKVSDGWCVGDPPGRWPPFNYQGVLSTSEIAYICEGEKASEAGNKIGLTCTTSAHGSHSPEITDWSWVKGKHIVIFPDNDKPGRGYAQAVAKLCRDAGAASVKIVELPNLPHKGDMVEFIAAGGTAEQIKELAANTPQWEPEAEPEANERTAFEDRPQGDPIEAAKLGVPYPCTDLGNAERLIAWFGDRIKWDIVRGVWRCWDGKRWKIDHEITLLELAGQMARKIRKEAAEAPPKKEGQPDIWAALCQHAKRSESRDKLAACVVVAKSLPGVAVDAGQWDTDPMLLNVQNGTIDLLTGILKPHDREDLITRLSPVPYYPDAVCSRWLKYLFESTEGDSEVILYLQKIAGYCLTGLTIEECLFFIFGITGSGKTTFLEALKVILGEYACTVDTEMLCKAKYNDGGKPSPEVARLDGARLAAGSEMEVGRELAAAKLKSMTGGEKIVTRYMRENPFEFMPQFKIILAMNDCPKASSDDTGLWRRLRRIGFNHAVPKEKRDKTLKPYLQNEGACAVLAWAVQGCLRWQRDGLGIPKAVEASTAKYQEESDPLNNWMQDNLSLKSGEWTGNAEIQRDYSHFCEYNGIKYPVSPKTIARKLTALGCKQGKRQGARGWEGVELKVDVPEEQNDNENSSENGSVDTLDGLDRKFDSFLYEANSIGSIKQSVLSVQCVQDNEKPMKNNAPLLVYGDIPPL